MPNYLHGIIKIYDNQDFKTADNIGTPPWRGPYNSWVIRNCPRFKTFSARKINEIRDNKYFSWQKSFHDRVIRNEKEFPPKADPPLVENNKRNYIIGNPAKWQEDHNNPINIKNKNFILK
ncbi:MAG: hypothetical protein GF365_04150 [Candidatus Buchananbacteria bacterium]|nr:hypothetical protein [Candidatus Buchananbacteria bacterium]